MSTEELQQLVEEVSLTYFNAPFQHQAIFNQRLKTTGGRYHFATHYLDFNPKILEVFGEEEFLGVVKHELCHYHLHLSGKGYRHRDRDFKELLKQVGGSRFVQSLREPKPEKTYWIYECKKCQQKLYRQRRFNTSRYICAKCKGSFQLMTAEKTTAE